jgi:hypothetical protein
MKFLFIDNDKGNPPGKLADCEIHFDHHDSPFFAGLKLIGFAVWERRGGVGRNVTFPARQYSVNGERRAFALLRPSGTGEVSDNYAMRDAVLTAYDDFCEARDKATRGRMTREAREARPAVSVEAIAAAAITRAMSAPALPGVEAVRTEDRAVPAVADVPFALSSEPARVAAVQDDLFSGGGR